MPAIFKTATDFRKSLEARLQAFALRTGMDLQRIRRKVAFDRLLARIYSKPSPQFFLKGEYAMELRIARARATKDIDLTCTLRVQKNEKVLITDLILEELQELARINLNDHFVYQIGEALTDLKNVPYGGSRFPVTGIVDGKLFVQFQLDVGADHLVDNINHIQGLDWLNFCGIPPPIIPMISIPQQFAEKIHIYTFAREDRVNTRVKDLIDMMLLLKMENS